MTLTILAAVAFLVGATATYAGLSLIETWRYNRQRRLYKETFSGKQVDASFAALAEALRRLA